MGGLEKRILGGEFVKEFTDIDDSNGGDGYDSTSTRFLCAVLYG